MTDLGALNYFLGISVIRDTSGMFLSQKKYKLLERAHMINFNPTQTPVDTESKLGPEGAPIYDPTFYRSLAAALKRIHRGRSTSGYCVSLGNNLLSWSFKRQHILSRSSVEAKYKDAANVIAKTAWLHNHLRELHTPLLTATLVYCDNVNVVYLFANLVQHQRTKHIKIGIYFVHDIVSVGYIRVLHVPSRYKYADIFTKGLPSTLFEEFRISLSRGGARWSAETYVHWFVYGFKWYSTLNEVTPVVDASTVKKVVTPFVVDMTLEKKKLSSLDDTTILGSFPSLPSHVTTSAGNASGKASYGNVTGKPIGKKVNFRSLFTLENPDVNLLKEDVSTVLVCVKLHGVTAFSEDGLSAIATKLGTPLMLDSYTSDMCMQSWGRSTYARAMIELRANVELKDNIMVVMPKITGEGYYTCNIRVEYEWKPPSGNKKKGVDPTNKDSDSNPFEVLNSVDNDVEKDYKNTKAVFKAKMRKYV
uniref:Ribonuclease H-like domain-containing protein n=1 Tax=Tanacetum cinerariifolium TaxID=118510 RepID=A0A699IFV2_TANCI|nr:ribonuclease H-like domain-containing protein [Tanacetum cinerariifolium]